ncbi:MAG TPA: DUF5777 family beta-barrel protein [Bacteroidia bacterium]|jgi:hypothetical protein|nr:DUF5777 family beta-barrel protein [Bacteroidia bacterium]
MKRNTYFFLALIFFGVNSFAQDLDLLNMVDSAGKPQKEFVSATFKSTRNINFHTSEILPARSLDLRISHRFGPLSSGGYNAWGIDGPANLMISLEYSYNGRWMVGAMRSFYEKMGTAFFKWKMIRQAKGGGSPVSVTYFGGVYNTFIKDPYLGQPDKFYNMNWDRVSFVNQLIVARKWNSRISTQIGGAYVHYNLVGAANGLTKNDCIVLTGVLRIKYTKRQAIIFEYGYRLDQNYGAAGTKYYDTFGLGWEIETGGHVFQIFAVNSFGIMENQYLIKTDSDWSSMGVRIGFNITRIFSVGGKKGEW